jgi:birA, biotin-[acetyl-CoA-carboxylase] ligase region
MTKFNLIKLNAIGSTNDWLKNKLQSGNCHDGDVVWTMNQTKGRGQYSNVWSSDSQKNITFSVFKRFSELNSDDSFLINCAVTLAIIETLEKFKIPNLKIKWPNDILSANNKIGGVLIENIIKGKKLNASITGIGINVNQKSFIDLPSAGSMFLQTNKKYDLKKVFEELLDTLDLNLTCLKSQIKSQLLSSLKNQ